MSSESSPRKPRSRRRPSIRALAGLGLLIGLGLGAASLLLVAGDGELRYTGVPRVEMALPPAASGFGPANDSPGTPRRVTLAELTPPIAEPPSAPAAEPEPPAAAVPPVLPDPGLSEPGPYGPLPRIGADGRTPLRAYARRGPPAADDRPRVALLVTGLGLQAEATEAALELPGPVSLAFSPYAPDLPAWMERARRAGHEVLLGLPMEPADYPDDDPGPHTLRAAPEDAGANLDRLAWVLAQGSGYVGVAGGGERFAAAEEAHRPVLAALSARGLGLVELGGDRLAATAEAVSLPYVATPPPMDADPTVLAIDFVLAGLEARALETGIAVGVAEPYPVTLARLRLWAETLADKGLVLAPVTALLLAGTTNLIGAERHGSVGPAAAPNG